MNKIVSKEDITRKKLLEGVNELAEPVISTMGPLGKTVIYEEDVYGMNKVGKGLPKITKDGVTVANHIKFEDPIKNIGASMVKQAANYTVQEAGDGTTASTLLSQVLINDALTFEGNTRQYAEGMEDAKKAILEELEKMSREVTLENISDVIRISTNSDEELTNVISTAFVEGGENVVLQPVRNSTRETYLEMEHGVTLESGLLDPVFANDVANNRFSAEAPLVFVSYSNFQDTNQLLPIIEVAAKSKRPLFLIGNFEPRILNSFAQNVKSGVITASFAKPPMIEGMAQQWLQDIADATGAVLHGPHLGDAEGTLSSSMLGECDFISQDGRKTVFQMKEKKISEDRLKALENEIAGEKNKGRIKTLKKRLANITGAIAVLHIGGDSDAELEEKFHRAEDAILSAAAALQRGILPGGGAALRDATTQVGEAEALPGHKHSNEDYVDGWNSVIKAGSAPFKRIVANAGLTEEECDQGETIDALSGSKVDALASGIVDPTLVVEQALKNSVSVAKQLANTSFSIVWENKQ